MVQHSAVIDGVAVQHIAMSIRPFTRWGLMPSRRSILALVEVIEQVGAGRLCKFH